ncbi:MAG: hypothetical protein IPG17_16170 [Sandaracinaceae bacterium]|nr:hypothetical protein [Sandaracinaceae bacterium]MBK7773654.1 hypothetical protein [Sandaracinaceae bacterium]MBP7681535.1 hypothetical protein [Deltaproteobacteria bacterium]
MTSAAASNVPRVMLAPLWLSCLVACGGNATDAERASAAPTAAAPAAAPSEVAAPPAAPASDAVVNLLAAGPVTLHASSAYRADPSQFANLVDGDANTAYRFGTGDVDSAWFVVSIPAGVHVEGLELIVGHGGRDSEGALFQRHPRVRSLFVSLGDMNAPILASPEFDAASAALQRADLRIDGPANVMIGVDAVDSPEGAIPRELWLSELHLLGRVDASVGPRTPTYRLGRRPLVLPGADDTPEARFRAAQEERIVANASLQIMGAGGDAFEALLRAEREANADGADLEAVDAWANVVFEACGFAGLRREWEVAMDGARDVLEYHRMRVVYARITQGEPEDEDAFDRYAEANPFTPEALAFRRYVIEELDLAGQRALRAQGLLDRLQNHIATEPCDATPDYARYPPPTRERR